MDDSRKNLICRLGFICLCILTLYASTLTHGFVWDDTSIIVQNPLLEKLGNIPRLFLSEDTAVGSTGYYRPVTYISLALDRAIWGANPAGFHLTNLLLHLLTALLFHGVAAALFGSARTAFIAALIFALHPIAGETVNFIAGGRNTLLSACFALLSLLMYIRKKHLFALAAFSAAIFAKEFALLLPLVFLFHDSLLKREKIHFRGYLVYLLPIACYLLLRSLAVQKANFLAGINLADTLKAPYLVSRYLLNLLAPFQLKVMYDIQPGMAATLLCAAILLVLTGTLYFFRKHADILFSLFWLFLFLLPVINIIPLQQAALMADRYAYFSLMGFALCLAAIISRWSGRAATAGIAALCAVYFSIGYTRSAIWKNETEFFSRMTLDAPEKFDGFQNLGMIYYKNGDIARALPYLKEASSKADISAMFLIGSASVFWKEGMTDRAEKLLLRAMELTPADAEPYLMLIALYERSGNSSAARLYRDKAERLFHAVDEMMGKRVSMLCREGETYMARRQYIPAENVFWQALMIDPDYIPALVNMGSVVAEQGKPAEALHYLNRALALEPSNATAHYNLAMVYRMQGRSAEAAQELARFTELAEVARQKKRSRAPW